MSKPSSFTCALLLLFEVMDLNTETKMTTKNLEKFDPGFFLESNFEKMDYSGTNFHKIHPSHQALWLMFDSVFRVFSEEDRPAWYKPTKDFLEKMQETAHAPIVNENYCFPAYVMFFLQAGLSARVCNLHAKFPGIKITRVTKTMTKILLRHPVFSNKEKQ